MSQHDYVIENQPGLAFRQDLNNALAAIVSQNSGITAPTTTYAYQFWVDTSVTPNLLKQRNAVNSGWLVVGDVTQSNLGLSPQVATQQNLYASAVASGTSDAIVAAFTPSVVADTLAAGNIVLIVRASAANTTVSPTFTPNSGTLTPANIVKGNNLPLAVGDISGAGYWMILQWDSTLSKWVLLNPAYGVTLPPSLLVAVRQTTAYGPMSATQTPALIPQNQLGNTLSTGVTLKHSVAPTMYTVANGFDAATGSEINLSWVTSTDLTIPNLAASSTNYIWVDTVSQTAGFTTVADSDQYGGTIPVTSGKYTFDTLGMKMYLGNGTVANQSNRLIVAEVDTNSTSVTSIRVRAYNGEDIPAFAGPLPPAATQLLRANMVGSVDVDITLEARCEVADIGYSVGDIVTELGQTNSAPISFWRSRTTLGFAVGSAGGLCTENKSSTDYNGLTQSRWSYRIRVKRRWG